MTPTSFRNPGVPEGGLSVVEVFGLGVGCGLGVFLVHLVTGGWDVAIGGALVAVSAMLIVFSSLAGKRRPIEVQSPEDAEAWFRRALLKDKRADLIAVMLELEQELDYRVGLKQRTAAAPARTLLRPMISEEELRDRTRQGDVRAVSTTHCPECAHLWSSHTLTCSVMEAGAEEPCGCLREPADWRAVSVSSHGEPSPAAPGVEIVLRRAEGPE